MAIAVVVEVADIEWEVWFEYYPPVEETKESPASPAEVEVTGVYINGSDVDLASLLSEETIEAIVEAIMAQAGEEE